VAQARYLSMNNVRAQSAQRSPSFGCYASRARQHWRRRNAHRKSHQGPCGRRSALLHRRRLLCVAEFAISKCNLACLCTGCRMLSLCGCALLCGEWVDLNRKTRPSRSGVGVSTKGGSGRPRTRLGDVDIFGVRGSAESLVAAKGPQRAKPLCI
jgi:hypothetical protein